MRILVVGLGSIGKRHVKNLLLINPKYAVAVLRSGKGNADPIPRQFSGVKIFLRTEDALSWAPSVVIIANPASSHIATALLFARKGSHLFIEKPIGTTLDGIRTLLRECHAKRHIVMVGYNLRFFEPLHMMKKAVDEGRIGKVLSIRASVGQYLPDWRSARDYRTTVSAKKKLGGGALFELSHELDYVRWICGEVTAVSSSMKKLSDLEIDVEDTADILLHFKNGAIGNVHVDMVDRASHRDCRIVGSLGTITWESEAGDSVRLYSANTGVWTYLRRPSDIDRNDMYLLAMKHFFYCIQKRKNPLVTGEDGLRVLKIALAAKKSALSEKKIVL